MARYPISNSRCKASGLFEFQSFAHPVGRNNTWYYNRRAIYNQPYNSVKLSFFDLLLFQLQFFIAKRSITIGLFLVDSLLV